MTNGDTKELKLTQDLLLKLFQYDKPGCGCLKVSYPSGAEEYVLCSTHQVLIKSLLKKPKKRSRDMAYNRAYNILVKAIPEEVYDEVQGLVPYPHTAFVQSSVIRSGQVQRTAVKKYFHQLLGKDQNHFKTLRPTKVLLDCIGNLPITKHEFANESGLQYTWFFSLPSKDSIQLIKLVLLAKTFRKYATNKSDIARFREACFDLLGIGNTREGVL